MSAIAAKSTTDMQWQSLGCCDSLPEAELYANLLRQAGIKVLLQRDPLPGVIGFMEQGVSVYVDAVQVEEAMNVLKELWSPDDSK